MVNVGEDVLNYFGLSRASQIAGGPERYDPIIRGETELIEPEFVALRRRHVPTPPISSALLEQNANLPDLERRDGSGTIAIRLYPAR